MRRVRIQETEGMKLSIEKLRTRREAIDERTAQLKPTQENLVMGADLIVATASALLLAGAIYDVGIEITAELKQISRLLRGRG